MKRAVSAMGVDSIIKSEDYRDTAYLDTAGVWTIGFGTTRYWDVEGHPPVRRGDRIDSERAYRLLIYAIDDFWDAIDGRIRVYLNQPMIDAIASFVYNIGVSAFRNSTMLKLLNVGNYHGASAQILRWNKETDRKTGQVRVNDGLSNRRRHEKAMFDFGIKLMEEEHDA